MRKNTFSFMIMVVAGVVTGVTVGGIVGNAQASSLDSIAALQKSNALGVSLTVRGDTLIIEADGKPTHATGTFPMMMDSNADGRPDNPNSIKNQNYRFMLPLNPKLSTRTTPLPMGPIAISLGGAVFYNAYTAEKTDAVINEVFDDCKGHPDMRGRYHYHQYSPCVPMGPKNSDGHSRLMGWAFDGFELYDVSTTGDADFDECQGHSDDIRGYHYHIKTSFPYVMGCYRGVSAFKESLPIGVNGKNKSQPPMLNGAKRQPPR